MSEDQDRWIAQIESYYRDKYPPSMRVKIVKILPDRREALSALFQTVIYSVSAQYRTVPDVLAIDKAWVETLEAYPELRSDSYNRQISQDRKQITEGDFSDGHVLLHALSAAISEGRNPAEDETVKDIMKRNGYMEVS